MRAKSRKLRTKKGFIRPIHITALFIILGYFLISKFVFLKSVTSASMTLSFLGPFTFGALTSFMFLYLFSHEDFFHFMKDIEKKEEKKEGLYLRKYKHLGKVAAVVIIALLGGSMLAALTVRLLLANFKYRYFILLVASFLSTLLSVGLTKGFISFL